MAVTKASIGAYFLRLSGKRYQKVTIYVTMTVVILYSIMYLPFLIFQCRPVAYLWYQFDQPPQTGTCVSHTVLADVTYAHAGISAATDLVLGLLPLTFIYGMSLTPRTKLSIFFILSLGFFASTATIVRIVYIDSLTQTTDYTWEGINLAKWSLVEPAIGITAAAIATLRPLFANFLAPHWLGLRVVSPARSRHRGESSKPLNRPSRAMTRSKSVAYSSEFAALMGLPDVGVTTTITVGEAARKSTFCSLSDTWLGRWVRGMSKPHSEGPDMSQDTSTCGFHTPAEDGSGSPLGAWNEKRRKSGLSNDLELGPMSPTSPLGSAFEEKLVLPRSSEEAAVASQEGKGILRTTVITYL
jgi:hypothetical protein